MIRLCEFIDCGVAVIVKMHEGKVKKVDCIKRGVVNVVDVIPPIIV